MTQAIGRARRYGQEKRVHIYRFVALRTIDVDIMEQRERRADAIWDSGSPQHELSKRNRDEERQEQRSTSTDKERTILVRDAQGRFALVPRSWIENRRGQSKRRIEVEDIESFGSLVKFSEMFGQDDSEL